MAKQTNKRNLTVSNFNIDKGSIMEVVQNFLSNHNLKLLIYNFYLLYLRFDEIGTYILRKKVEKWAKQHNKIQMQLVV